LIILENPATNNALTAIDQARGSQTLLYQGKLAVPSL